MFVEILNAQIIYFFWGNSSVDRNENECLAGYSLMCCSENFFSHIMRLSELSPDIVVWPHLPVLERVPEDVFIFPIVKPMLQFIQIGV